MKKVITLIFAVLFLVSLCVPAGAISIDEEPSSSTMTKAEFAEYCHNLNSAKARTASVLSQGEVDQLLMQYALSQSSTERTQLENQLNAAGVYIYSDGSEYQVSPLSVANDVILNAVICSYNDNTGDWSLVGGGYWPTISPVIEDYGGITGFLGDTYDVGGVDAVGITITNTSGTVPALKASSGMIHDGLGNSITLNNPSTGNTSAGIAFEYQDYLTVIEVGLINNTLSYMGYGFSAVMRFDSSFMNWNGSARTFYAHTWNSTTISEIQLGVSSETLGVDITWSVNSNKFLAYNSSDTVF